MDTADSNSKFEALLDHLKRSRGFDFTGYKRASLMRRIDKQMNAANVDGYADYMDYLEANPEEIARLLNTLLINVTSFFRDAAVWELLQTDVVPGLVETKSPNQPVRAWSAGCASGEEAFTLAMILAESLGMERFSSRVKIYATDIDEEALSQARQAIFTTAQVSEIPPEFLGKYFEQVGGRYVLHKELRRAVIFGRHNLVQDVPISHLDLLICRNTMMYFNTDIQARILARFHFALNDGGFLILGKAETLLINSHLFSPLDLKRRFFVKISNGNGRSRPVPASQNEVEEARTSLPVPPRLPDAAFDISPLAQIVIDANGVLTLANERARTAFRLTPRDLGRPFHDMELSYRPLELRSFIDKVTAERYPVLLKEIAVRSGGENDITFYDVQVVPILSPSNTSLGVSISFLEVTAYKRLHEELESSNRELASAYEEAQSATEELETTNEELQASAEELETTNEELQSTNEEMETMNEELQSANEELQTMNDELRQRSLDASRMGDFMESVLGSLRAGIVVTDLDLRVQTWNYQAEDLWGLRGAEVVGKNLLSLDMGLPIDRLVSHLRACLAGTSLHEEVELEATNRRGQLIMCRFDCTPLMDPARNIRGAILVMQEIMPLLEDGPDASQNGNSRSDDAQPMQGAEA